MQLCLRSQEFRWLESGNVHTNETKNHHEFICIWLSAATALKRQLIGSLYQNQLNSRFSTHFYPLQFKLPQPTSGMGRHGRQFIGRVGSFCLSLLLADSRGHGWLVLLFLLLIVFLISSSTAWTALTLAHLYSLQ